MTDIWGILETPGRWNKSNELLRVEPGPGGSVHIKIGSNAWLKLSATSWDQLVVAGNVVQLAAKRR